MLAAVRGVVQGNTVIIQNDDVREYDGTEVIITLLNCPQKKRERKRLLIGIVLLSQVKEERM